MCVFFDLKSLRKGGGKDLLCDLTKKVSRGGRDA